MLRWFLSLTANKVPEKETAAVYNNNNKKVRTDGKAATVKLKTTP